MSIRMNEENGGKVLAIHVSGTLEKADYVLLEPQFERLIRKHGKMSLLFDMSDFHGWELSAALEDFKFGMKHFSDIERIAMIGENKWQQAMTVVAKPFTKAEVRYFEHADASQARTWLNEA